MADEALLALLAGLPDEALVPVGWLREQAAETSPPDRPVSAVTQDESRTADLTADEVAEQLGRTPSCIRSWLRKGVLRGYRLRGKEWRVKRAELEAFLEREAARNAVVQDERNAPKRRKSSSSADLGAWRRELKEGAA